MSATGRTLSIPVAAIALACSWCWVIGMVFPIFMIQDFGWLGWLVFVVPNVIGAASVGFVLKSGEQAARFIETHRVAIRVFTWVTIAFHGFVMVWAGSQMATSWQIAAWTPPVVRNAVAILGPAFVVLFLAGRCAQRKGMRTVARIGVTALIASALCFVLAAVTTNGDAYTLPPTDGAFPSHSALFALTGTSLGFLTCPFLDVTFLRIRQELDKPARSRRAFAIGFTGPFLLLVAMTAFYAGGFITGGVTSDYIIAHLGFQSAFTVGFHAWALRRTAPEGDRRSSSIVTPFCVGIACYYVVVILLNRPFRLGYELILSAYALPFPAYVWIVCVWARRPSRRAINAFLLTCIGAGPFFAIGYLDGNWPLVPVGVLIVLAGPLLLKIPSRDERTDSVESP